MCSVKSLNDSERRVNVITKDGRKYYSSWYIDNGEKIDGINNCTESEIAAYNKLLLDYNLNEEDIETWYVSRKREKENLYISDHAFKRMKERCGWSKKTALRMVEKIYENGQDISEIKGYLAPWAKQREERQNDKEYSLLYGKFVYVFSENTLVTVVPTPQKGKVNY
jgi:hypothetical protein